MRKIMALALAFIMMFALSAIAFAEPAEETDTVTITVTRDTATYAGEDDADSRTFTWYRVFTASYGDEFTGNSQKDGGYDTDGSPLQPAGDEDHPVSYIASADVAEKLGTWVPAAEEDNPETADVDESKAHWVKKASTGEGDTGNLWFKLTPIAGSDNYTVEWDNASTTAATVQEAAAWLKANNVYDETGTLTFSGSGDNAKWSADGLEKGYYLLVSEAGNNLIAATTDIEVKEKNSYPPLDKKQKDEDADDYQDENVKVAVGDIIDYTVTVTIPNTAKVGEKILVYDKNSSGLEYVINSLKVDSNVGEAEVGTSDYSGDGAVSGAAWQRLITVTEKSKGKDVVFAFQMKVTSDALTDEDKENESGLKYGPGSGTNPFPYESVPDEVHYETYFAGIHKIDGETKADLEGVEFTLKEDGELFFVEKNSDGVYVPVAAPIKEEGESEEDFAKRQLLAATVVTDENGMIKIRGLDNDKPYTLTETKTLDGYNMLDSDIELKLYIDTVTTEKYEPADSFESGKDYYVKDGNNYTKAEGLEAFEDGVTYYTKTEATSTFGDVKDVKTSTTWSQVENNKGSILPSTGGIGTTIFYAIGMILVLGAVALFISKRRLGINK